MKTIEMKQAVSTNSQLDEMLQQGELTENTLLVAYSQTAGKGMATNKWHSEENKNATFSIYLKVNVETAEIFKISVACSLAIYEYLNSIGVKNAIKWPNDIYYEDKKLGGILIENKLQGECVTETIIGVGLNLNQENFPKNLPNPISLKNITGKDYDVKEVAVQLSQAIEQKINQLQGAKFSDIRLDYLLKLYCFGKIMMWKIKGIKDEISGSIIDVKPSGKIVMQAVSGQICECDIKEIRMIDE